MTDFLQTLTNESRVKAERMKVLSRYESQLNKGKQATGVFMVSNWMRETVVETLVDDLNKDPGTNTLLTNLDSLFLEEKDQTYDVYFCFEKITTDPV